MTHLTLLRASGLVIVLLGVVHLIATPHVLHLIAGMPDADRELAAGPILLNHVLVSVLLLPLGISTWIAASKQYAAQSWAKRVLAVNALAVLALPISILLFIRQAEYYQLPLFVGGVALTFTAALLVGWATWSAIASKS